MKILFMFYHLLAFLLLGAATWLQLNDPDPLFWGGFYALCALVPLLTAVGVENRVLYVLCLVYGLVVMGPTVDGVSEYLRHADTESLLQGMALEKPYIEEAREFLGALIALGLITICFLIGRKRGQR